MSTCEKRRELLENSETWWGQMRWKAHVRSCRECAELTRVEQEMTSLLQGLGSWEEPPGLAEQVARRLSSAAPAVEGISLLPVEPSPASPALRRKARWLQWTIGFVFALLIVGAVVLSNVSTGGDVAFADVMELLSQQTAFRTSGVILEGSPQGTIRHYQFEQTAERDESAVMDRSVRYKIQWRLWRSSHQTPSEFQSRMWFPVNLDFPNVLFEETKRDDKGDIRRSRIFPPTALENKSRYQFMFTGLLLLSRSAADHAIHHPSVDFKESQETIVGKPGKVFTLTVRDTQGNAVSWRFHVSYQTRLPYRVEATYRLGTDIIRRADYVIDYLSVRR